MGLEPLVKAPIGFRTPTCVREGHTRSLALPVGNRNACTGAGQDQIPDRSCFGRGKLAPGPERWLAPLVLTCRGNG